MLDKKYFAKLYKDFKLAEGKRSAVHKAASDGLHAAKRAIFSFHRNDWKSGEANLVLSLKGIEAALAQVGEAEVKECEGVVQAATEEYVEAELFRQFLYKETLGEPRGLKVDWQTYLAGLTDTVGEISRYVVKQATERQLHEVNRAKEMVEEIMASLIEFNLTGYLRTKFDQAKQARRKIEEVAYDLSLKINKKFKSDDDA